MRIVDEKLLRTFRVAGPCEYCKRWCQVREPHHLFGRGCGGATRLDVRINLIALGSSRLFACQCHQEIHAGRVSREDLLLIVSAREGLLQHQIEEQIYAMRRAPKEIA